MKKYILFDLDGTLTDPMEGICKSAARGLAHFGIKADYHDLTFFIGPPLLDTYRDRYGMNDEQAREAVAAFREYFQPTGIYENEIYPGIEERIKGIFLRWQPQSQKHLLILCCVIFISVII